MQCTDVGDPDPPNFTVMGRTACEASQLRQGSAHKGAVSCTGEQWHHLSTLTNATAWVYGMFLRTPYLMKDSAVPTNLSVPKGTGRCRHQFCTCQEGP